MLTIDTNIEINCSADKVWQVLMDFDNYPQWNSFIKRIEVLHKKPVQLNSQLQVTLDQQAGKTMSFSPVVTCYKPHESFHWLGKLFIKGIFDGEHRFELMPSERFVGGTLLVHQESFTGILVPFFKRSLNTTTKTRFVEMNVALKQYCDSLSFANQQTENNHAF